MERGDQISRAEVPVGIPIAGTPGALTFLTLKFAGLKNGDEVAAVEFAIEIGIAHPGVRDVFTLYPLHAIINVDRSVVVQIVRIQRAPVPDCDRVKIGVSDVNSVGECVAMAGLAQPSGS